MTTLTANYAQHTRSTRERVVRVREVNENTPRLRLPEIPGAIAAILTGALCGGLTVLLAWATSEGCSAVRASGTCGSFGLYALIAILAIDVVLGSALLRSFGIVEATTASLLGVGLVGILALLFFLNDTQSVAMVYVIPILMALSFGVAWWFTSAIAQGTEE